ncbi:unnamed protein product [Blepharisma stoltei]|uniref:pyruvate kinase n=1 Tax=Blepharisma stoltei TaxID=1481888 RepID=A0AAU9J9W2_9CILI|nr:unnamed protein product [Blepharisma stoltei]
MAHLARKTKIACTLGKSSSSKEVLIELLRSGMDIARISDRFLTISKQEVLTNLREAMDEAGIHVGIMVGLRESDLRLGYHSSNEPLILQKEDTVQIITTPIAGIEGHAIQCNNMEFPNLVIPGDHLLIDFGKIVFTVIEIRDIVKTPDPADILDHRLNGSSDDLHHHMKTSGSMNEFPTYKTEGMHKSDSFHSRPKRTKPKTAKHRSQKVVICRVEQNCTFLADKPVHIRPIGKREAPVSYANDIEDIKDATWASENDLDFLVYKQVRDEIDLADVFTVPLPNIKKYIGIQNKDSADLKESLIRSADGIVIGRGMLALETSLAEVCRMQKEIIKLCNELGKPVVISTQLLESMVHKHTPSSSEVTDITNAVLDGCDALLLTGETAYGDNPVAALQACSRICLEAERFLDYQSQCESILSTIRENITVAENICYCAVRSILTLNGKLIVCLTQSGYTAQLISRFMPPCMILALTDSMKTLHSLRIVRGVYPVFIKNYQGPLIGQAMEIIKQTGLGKVGDVVAYLGSFEDHFEAGATSSLKIITIV